jgi:hypothetical protein
MLRRDNASIGDGSEACRGIDRTGEILIGAGAEATENEMRLLVASLIAVLVIYFWDADYNNGQLRDGLKSMVQSIEHSVGR